MDYKNKSIKYYYKLKGGVDHTTKYFSLITDKIIRDKCDQPKFIRVLQHPTTKKIIILLGEKHEDNLYHKSKRKDYENYYDRLDPNKGIDLILGQISKRISNAQIKEEEGYDRVHKVLGSAILGQMNKAHIPATSKEVNEDNKDNPFHKVLLLIERSPMQILLGGNKKELAKDLFLEESNSLEYVADRFRLIEMRYKNVLNKAVDIRDTLDIIYGMSEANILLYNRLKKDSSLTIDDIYVKLNTKFQTSISNINTYIINDQEYININAVKYSLPPFADEMNKEFFGDTYTKKPAALPRKLSEVFVTTKDLYTNLRELFIEFMAKHTGENKDILINPIFNHLSEQDKLELFFNHTSELNVILCRVMDLYVLEYINLMPNNSTTVLYAGATHTRFLFNELNTFDGYKTIEIEDESYIMNSVYPDKYNTCERVFPSFNTNLDELNTKYINIKNIFDTKSPDEQSKFIKNMLTMDYTSNLPVVPNLELKLGIWEDIISNNPNFLFETDYSRS